MGPSGFSSTLELTWTWLLNSTNTLTLVPSGRMCMQWGLIREGFLRRCTVPEREAQFRQKAQPMTTSTYLPDHPSPGPCYHSLCPFPSAPAARGGRCIGSSPHCTVQTTHHHGNHATCHSCWSPQRQPESCSCSFRCSLKRALGTDTIGPNSRIVHRFRGT